MSPPHSHLLEKPLILSFGHCFCPSFFTTGTSLFRPISLWSPLYNDGAPCPSSQAEVHLPPSLWVRQRAITQSKAGGTVRSESLSVKNKQLPHVIPCTEMSPAACTAHIYLTEAAHTQPASSTPEWKSARSSLLFLHPPLWYTLVSSKAPNKVTPHVLKWQQLTLEEILTLT